MDGEGNLLFVTTFLSIENCLGNGSGFRAGIIPRMFKMELIDISSIDIFVVVFILWLSLKAVKWWKDPMRKIPGPPGLPFLGNTIELVKSDDLHALRLQWSRKYGKIYKTRLIFDNPRLQIISTEYAKHILVTNNTNYAAPKEFVLKLLPGLGNSLLTSNGTEHSVQRKHLNPAFSLDSVKDYVAIFNQKGHELVKFLDDKLKSSNGKSIEMELMTKFNHVTLDIIGLCAFGYPFNSVVNGYNEESECISQIVSGSSGVHRKLIESKLPLLKLLPSKGREEGKHAERACEELIRKVIEKRKEEQKAGIETKEKDLLRKLMVLHQDEGKGMSSKDLYHQIFSFMFAGHHTSSLTMTWTLYLLAKHPEFQDKVRQEIAEVIGDKSDVSYDDTSKVKILDNCIKEAMRLYPAAPLIGRRCIKDDKIGPYVIPANTELFIDLGSLFRSEERWKRPDDYNPDRFNEKDGTDPLASYYFMPFARGPRMCIGYRFAELEIRVVLVLLLRKFSFGIAKSCPEVIKTIPQITMKPNPAPILEIQLT